MGFLYETEEMACGCKVPLEDYPETAEWGPLFWKLLHTLAEFCGKQNDIVLRNDEIRLWTYILSSLEYCIPCKICQNHYKQWINAHPLKSLETLPYIEIGPWIRHWLWSLHNEINEGNDKPYFEESSLSEVYRSVSITNTWNALEPVMNLAIKLNGMKILFWKKWLGYIRTLQGLYGI